MSKAIIVSNRCVLKGSGARDSKIFPEVDCTCFPVDWTIYNLSNVDKLGHGKCTFDVSTLHAPG